MIDRFPYGDYDDFVPADETEQITDYLEKAKQAQKALIDHPAARLYDVTFALIAIAEELRLWRQFVTQGEPIDSSPIDAADPLTCPVCHHVECVCIDKVPGQ